DVAALSSAQFSDTVRDTTISQPWWLTSPRTGDIFGTPVTARPDDEQRFQHAAFVSIEIDGVPFGVAWPVTVRHADAIKGEVQRPLAIVPAVSVTVAQPVQYVPANRPFERVVRQIGR